MHYKPIRVITYRTVMALLGERQPDKQLEYTPDDDTANLFYSVLGSRKFTDALTSFQAFWVFHELAEDRAPAEDCGVVKAQEAYTHVVRPDLVLNISHTH